VRKRAEQMPERRQGELLLLFLTMIWGTTFITTRTALNGVSPLVLLGLRFSIGFVILFVVFIRRMLRVTRMDLWAGFVLSVIFFIGNALQTTGLKYTSAGISGFITAMSVVLVPPIAAVILREKARLSAIFGIGLATVGLALLLLGDSLNISLGDTLTLGCAVAFAFHIVFVTKYAPQTEPTVIVAVQLAISAAASFIMAAFTQTLQAPSTDALLVAIYLGVAATALGFVLQVYGQRKTTATRAALIFTMEPVFAAFFAYIVAGETLTQRGLVGCLLILVGILASELL
jgi:drug/metabolite transporter (DMT)-like permease